MGIRREQARAVHCMGRKDYGSLCDFCDVHSIFTHTRDARAPQWLRRTSCTRREIVETARVCARLPLPLLLVELLTPRPFVCDRFEWTLQHSLSFFFCAAVLGGRFETQLVLTPRAKKILWLVPPPVLCACWVIYLFSSGTSVPYDAATSQANFLLGVFAALLPWAVAGILSE